MGIKLYYDICEDEIPEESQDEPHWKTGNLALGFGTWQDPDKMFFSLDTLCTKCTNEIKIALDLVIDRLLPKKDVEKQ